MKEELTNREKREGQTIIDYNIKCPYCGYIDEYAWDYRDLDESELECKECGSIMVVTRETIPKYIAGKKGK